jgi:hypothetical protein
MSYTYFQLSVSDEQLACARTLVTHSLEHHRIPNIWDGTSHQQRTDDLRFTGTLGEIVFADTYRLPRPTRSFGADDGQDHGLDFELCYDGLHQRFDLKTMRRQNNRFYGHYVLNIPASQLLRTDSRTEYYFHVSLHLDRESRFVATFFGYVEKAAIRAGQIGTLFPSGCVRTRGDGSSFSFHADTYEICFRDFTPPPVSDRIRAMAGFQVLRLK